VFAGPELICLLYCYQILHQGPKMCHPSCRRNTTTLQPLYRSTCCSRHPQFRAGGFYWSKLLLPAIHCWWQPVHSDYGEEAKGSLQWLYIHPLCAV